MDLSFLYEIQPKPYRCPGCEEPSSHPICRICLSLLRKNPRMIPFEGAGVEGIFPIYISHSIAHQILKHWKNHGGSTLEQLLLRAHPSLQQSLVSKKFSGMIPIPQDRERTWKRGHSSSLKTAEFFSSLIDVPVFEILKLTDQDVQKQAFLSEWERKHHPNPFEVLKVEIPAHLNRILIVDDFITTGSTIHKAASRVRELYPDSQIFAASLSWIPRKVKGVPQNWASTLGAEETPSRF